MKVTLQSTEETQLTGDGQLARFWAGQTEEGVPVFALITMAVLAVEGAAPGLVVRTAQALECRYTSTCTFDIALQEGTCRDCGCTAFQPCVRARAGLIVPGREEPGPVEACTWAELPDENGRGLCSFCAERYP